MTGEASKAQDVFQDTLREAAFLAANGEPPADRCWFFREARWRCLDVGAQGVQPEHGASESTEVSPKRLNKSSNSNLNNWRFGFRPHRNHNAAPSPSIISMNLTIAK